MTSVPRNYETILYNIHDEIKGFDSASHLLNFD